jgi:hypothetical protein
MLCGNSYLNFHIPCLTEYEPYVFYAQNDWNICRTYLVIFTLGELTNTKVRSGLPFVIDRRPDSGGERTVVFGRNAWRSCEPT